MDDRMRLDAIDLNACLLFVSRRSVETVKGQDGG